MKRPAATSPDNPYAAPGTALGLTSQGAPSGVWSNRLAAAGFLLSLAFPFCVIAAAAVMWFWDDNLGVPYWRVYRLIRKVIYRCSLVSAGSLAVNLLALRRAPRKLALYGLLLGALGTGYAALALLGMVRR